MNNVEYIIYQFWTGTNLLTPNRLNALKHNVNIKVPTKLIMANDLDFYFKQANVECHPAYKYLSTNHKSDYLRCYFMHHFGGGYADIKPYSQNNNWKECFDLINSNSKIDIIGSKEIKNGAAFQFLNTDENLKKLIANGYFIVRPNSFFTKLWYDAVNKVLTEKYEQLKLHPALDVFGKNPDYPLQWTELCGSILHKIEYVLYDIYPEKINRSLNEGRIRIAYR